MELQEFSYAPTYVEAAKHANDPAWQTGGDRPLSSEEQAHNHDMIADYRKAHPLADSVEIVLTPLS